MKWISVILAIFVVYLAIKPCDHNHSISLSQEKSTDFPLDDCNHVCTPFCVCNSIGFLVSPIFNWMENTSDLELSSNVYFSNYNSVEYKATEITIWQPPKLS